MAAAVLGAGDDLGGGVDRGGFVDIGGLLGRRQRTDEVGRVRLREQFKRLTLPTEMGERFQVMGFSRDVDLSAAFAMGDLTWRL